MVDIQGIRDSEKMDRFTEGLKPYILLEVWKASQHTFEEAARIALDIDGAFYCAGFFYNRKFGYNSGFQSGPVRMEIEDV